MIFRPSRDPNQPGRFFALKSLILVLGASLAAVGMASDNSLIVYVAMGVITVGIILRFVR